MHRHGVNPKSTSAQLPTVIVYENGKADNWRPCIGNDKKLKKYVFSEVIYTTVSESNYSNKYKC